MAKIKLYQVYDNVAETVLGPIVSATKDAAAIRNFQEALAHPESNLSKAPGDFDLLALGTQETSNGTVEPTVPFSIYKGAQWARERARASSAPAETTRPDADLALSINTGEQ